MSVLSCRCYVLGGSTIKMVADGVKKKRRVVSRCLHGFGYLTGIRLPVTTLESNFSPAPKGVDSPTLLLFVLILQEVALDLDCGQSNRRSVTFPRGDTDK